jgi:hypothetical protein
MAILNKMTGFKVYRGTKETFISSGKATTYADAVVFITGGEGNEKNSCIFAQGTYFASIAEMIKAINFVKGVQVGDNQYNASVGGGYIPFASGDSSTVALDVQNGTITIGLTDTFVNKVNSTAAALGTADEPASETGSAFARIANLAALVSDLTGGTTTSIAGQITEAINGLRSELAGDLTDATDAKTLAAINDELNAIDAKWASYVSKAELAEIKDTKANGTIVNVSVSTEGGKVTAVAVNETGLTSALNLKANAADVYTKTDADAMAQDKVNALANGAVKDNADAIAKLNGNSSVDGSVDKKIVDAIDAFAAKVSDNGTIDTLKELVDYVAGVDGSDKLASAIAQITENTGKIATLNGDDKTAGSVAKAVSDEALIRKDADDAINLRIDSIASVVGAPESDVEATGIFKVIEENEKTTSNALTDLNTRLQDVESKKESIESALQVPDIATGSANGTISVKGVDVEVKGLGSAAYTETSAYATAAQGVKADTAYQKPTAGIPASDLAFAVYTQAEVDAMWAWEEL